MVDVVVLVVCAVSVVGRSVVKRQDFGHEHHEQIKGMYMFYVKDIVYSKHKISVNP